MTHQQYCAITGAGRGPWADACTRAYDISHILAAAVLCDRATWRQSKSLALTDLREAERLSNLRAISPDSVPYTQEELIAAGERWRDLLLTELDAEGREIAPQEPD